MRDRPNKESAREQYRRLAQACLEMVPTIQDQEGRDALMEMARVWLRLAETYKDRQLDIVRRCVAERVMKYINKYLLALSVVVSVAAFASQASAQNTAGRDAAIGRCIRVAHLQYPNEEQQIQRADVYKACMVAAGYQP
jgi:hypothetical protein